MTFEKTLKIVELLNKWYNYKIILKCYEKQLESLIQPLVDIEKFIDVFYKIQKDKLKMLNEILPVNRALKKMNNFERNILIKHYCKAKIGVKELFNINDMSERTMYRKLEKAKMILWKNIEKENIKL